MQVPGVIVALAGSFIVSYAQRERRRSGFDASIGLAPRTEQLALIIAGIALAGLGWLPGLLGAIGLIAVLPWRPPSSASGTSTGSPPA